MNSLIYNPALEIRSIYIINDNVLGYILFLIFLLLASTPHASHASHGGDVFDAMSIASSDDHITGES